MKRLLFYSLMICLGICTLQQALAQRSRARKAAVKGGASKLPAKPLPQVEVVLGSTGLSSATLPKRAFDSLARQKIRVATGGTIQGFTFTYAEQMLYEDSAGNPLRQTDYLVEYCLGDSLSAGIRSSLFERSKPGDTAYFNEIKVLLPNGEKAAGKMMKFIISR